MSMTSDEADLNNVVTVLKDMLEEMRLCNETNLQVLAVQSRMLQCIHASHKFDCRIPEKVK